MTEFKNRLEFISYFKYEKVCIKYFEQIRFKDGEYCPHCGHGKINHFSNGKRYRCAKCKKDFTIKTKTIFGESKIPIQKWFIAIYSLTTNEKGISPIELAKYVGVTQKTAWFMGHRIRQAMKPITKKNLRPYMNEFVYRFNARKEKIDNVFADIVMRI